MGLAEPRKRLKISHDPRNLAWSSQSSSTSYGHRLMTQQGWSEGQALGARSASTSTSSSKSKKHHSGLSTDAERLAAARVGILFKDDNLGLGAKRKGGQRDVEQQRTGLDAFQGLLGRLNGKEEAVLRREEQKVEERKLEMFFRGRWGGMVFVRGGVLVGSRGDGEKEEEKESQCADDVDGVETQNEVSEDQTKEKDSESEERPRLKEEKRQRKEERKKRRDEKALRKAARKSKKQIQENAESEDSPDQETKAALPTHKIPISQPPDEPVSSAPSENEVEKATKKRRRKSELSSIQTQVEQSRSSSPSFNVLRNGRHLLRGRNILAKKMVLVDAKGLDQIFMR